MPAIHYLEKLEKDGNFRAGIEKLFDSMAELIEMENPPEYEDDKNEYDEDEDTKLDFDQNVTILLDELSYPYIMGSKVDYVENLMGAKFVIDNPNAKTTCGCGASFSI